MSLPFLPAKHTIALAKMLQIKQHVGGMAGPWEPNAEQILYWECREASPWILAGKPRQIGLSTAVCLDDVTCTLIADAEGNRVRTAIVVDTDDHAIERVAVCADFCRQMGLDDPDAGPPVKILTHSITFPNGSTIEAFTAGGDNVGRSVDVQRYHLTELPYWPSPESNYNDLMQSLSLGCACVIETTMDTVSPFPRWLWDSPNDYKKLFFPVEMHGEYRRDGNELGDARWKKLQEEGFTSREAAAWFHWAVLNKCGGDEVKAFREYPQTERHMFQVASGLWVQRRPTVVEPKSTFTYGGVRGDDWLVRVYREPKDAERCLIGIDTAEGKGRDRSVAIVVDEKDWTICALCVSDRMLYDDLAGVGLELQKRYSKERKAIALIEEIGIGSATVIAAQNIGLIHEVVTPTAEGKYEGLLAAKMAVESGLLFGPHELTEEADELHRNPKTGEFVGRKDVLMSYGFCARRMKAAPWLAKPKPVVSEERIDGKAIIRRMQRAERHRGMRW